MSPVVLGKPLAPVSGPVILGRPLAPVSGPVVLGKPAPVGTWMWLPVWWDPETTITSNHALILESLHLGVRRYSIENPPVGAWGFTISGLTASAFIAGFAASWNGSGSGYFYQIEQGQDTTSSADEYDNRLFIQGLFSELGNLTSPPSYVTVETVQAALSTIQVRSSELTFGWVWVSWNPWDADRDPPMPESPPS